MALESGTKIGICEVTGKLGEGGMGEAGPGIFRPMGRMF